MPSNLWVDPPAAAVSQYPMKICDEIACEGLELLIAEYYYPAY